MDFSKVYNRLLSLHSFLPFFIGQGKSLPAARVQLELTYRCNLRCPMCYQDKIYKKGERELTGNEWIKIIKQLPRFSLITLIGGEPLVHPDFEKIANCALASHPVNLVTNGVLLTSKMNKFLIKKRLLLVGVSVDGTGKIHDQMRGVSGTYKKVIFNLKNLQKQKSQLRAKLPLLDIKTVVTKTNLRNLDELFKVVQRLQADFFTLSLPKVSENQFNPQLKEKLTEFSPLDFSLLKKIDFPYLRKVLKKISSHRSGVKIRFYPQFSAIEKIGQNLYNQKLIKKNFSPCRQPWSAVQITATGNLYPCLSLNLGNMKEESFNKIWNGKKICQFRNRLKKAKLFPSCLGCCYLKQKR